MNRLLFVGFAFLAFTFYVMSDGPSFDPVASRNALMETRQNRESLRIAALPAPGEAFAARADTAEDTPPTRSDETSSEPLNLASFDDISASVPEPEASPPPLLLSEKPAPRPVPAEIIPETELSIAALDTAPTARSDFAFAGNTISAASGSETNAVEIRTVQGSRVNMRAGPGTDYDVVDQLVQSTQVEVLTDSGNGWVELRAVNGGQIGWIAEFLLSDG